MDLRKAWDALRDWSADRARKNALSEFTCAHCESFEKCGRPPSDDCVQKLEQIERGDEWRYRPAVRASNPRHLQY